MEPTHQFDLEKEIQGWRNGFKEQGIFTTDNLDELEAHLYDLIEDQLADGRDPKTAYDQALLQIGDSNSLKAVYLDANQGQVWRHRLWITMLGVWVFFVLYWGWVTTYSLGGYITGFLNLSPTLDRMAGLGVSLSILMVLILLMHYLVFPGRSLASLIPSRISRQPLWLFGIVGLLILSFFAPIWSWELVTSDIRNRAYWSMGWYIIPVIWMLAYPVSLWLSIRKQETTPPSSPTYLWRSETIYLLFGGLMGFGGKMLIECLAFLSIMGSIQFGMGFDSAYSIMLLSFVCLLLLFLAVCVNSYVSPLFILPGIQKKILSSSYRGGIAILIGGGIAGFLSFFARAIPSQILNMRQSGSYFQTIAYTEIIFFVVFSLLTLIWSYRRIRNRTLIVG
ncbi:MAG: hypothetical protein AAF587_41925 [Bacteroidota bacterium]